MPAGWWRDAWERLFVQAASWRRVSRATAHLADLRLPGPLLRPLLRAYVRAYGVDLSVAAEPLESHRTFNSFFTRRLTASARPVAPEPDVVVAPADARLQSAGPVPEDGRLEQIKGRSYPLEALLGGAQEAAIFRRGVYATLYLSPAMYHRVHSPIDGRICAWRYIPGRLFPVNPMAVRRVDGLFTVNERVVVRIDSDVFGPMAVVLVGAANVGRISLAFDGVVTNSGLPPTAVRPREPLPIARGEELGVFNLGSTVVLLAADASLRLAGAAVGDLVRFGQALWRRGA
jgi:phosphatidylserine decarboxylase